MCGLEREGLLSKLPCSDDLVFMGKKIEGLRKKISKWKEPFESKAVKVNLGKTNMKVS